MDKAKNQDPNNELVQNVVDGWELKDGRLYLLVRCADGIVRPSFVKREGIWRK